MLEVNKKDIAETFREALLDPSEGNIQLQFLEDRPLDDSTIDFWNIGYCPPYVTYLPFPLLSGRIIVPLFDMHGNLASFFGRRLDGNAEEISVIFDENYGDKAVKLFWKWINAKWINEVYDKERHLFGLYQNMNTIMEKGYIVIVEGGYDVIALWDKGIRNVVALCGTSLSDYHIALILRLGISKIVMMLDNDDAGLEATPKAVEKLRAFKMDCRTAVLPAGLDPEDYVRQRDAGSLISQLDSIFLEKEETRGIE